MVDSLELSCLIAQLGLSYSEEGIPVLSLLN
jgi:hypothetical protein